MAPKHIQRNHHHRVHVQLQQGGGLMCRSPSSWAAGRKGARWRACWRVASSGCCCTAAFHGSPAKRIHEQNKRSEYPYRIFQVPGRLSRTSHPLLVEQLTAPRDRAVKRALCLPVGRRAPPHLLGLPSVPIHGVDGHGGCARLIGRVVKEAQPVYRIVVAQRRRWIAHDICLHGKSERQRGAQHSSEVLFRPPPMTGSRIRCSRPYRSGRRPAVVSRRDCQRDAGR